MEIILKKMNGKDDLVFPKNKLIGLITDIDIKDYIYNKKNNIIVDNEKVTPKNKLEILKKIEFVNRTFTYIENITTVEEYMNYYISFNSITVKDPNKKILDSLKIVGLKEKILNLDISVLSRTEKYLINLALAFLNNPKEIIIEDLYTGLDIKEAKRLYRLVMELNDKYNINIVVISNDTESLYRFTNYLIIYKSDKIIEGNTKDILQDVDMLNKLDIDMPDIIEFTYKAKEIGAKIDYHRDIRDIIKDIYKNLMWK